MDFKQIQELIKMINKSNIGEVSIEEKGFKLTIKQKEEAGSTSVCRSRCHQPQPMTTMAAPPVAASVSNGGRQFRARKGRQGCRTACRQYHVYHQKSA